MEREASTLHAGKQQRTKVFEGSMPAHPPMNRVQHDGRHNLKDRLGYYFVELSGAFYGEIVQAINQPLTVLT